MMDALFGKGFSPQRHRVRRERPSLFIAGDQPSLKLWHRKEAGNEKTTRLRQMICFFDCA